MEFRALPTLIVALLGICCATPQEHQWPDLESLRLSIAVSPEEWSELLAHVSSRPGMLVTTGYRVSANRVQLNLVHSETKDFGSGPVVTFVKQNGHWVPSTDQEGQWFAGVAMFD